LRAAVYADQESSHSDLLTRPRADDTHKSSQLYFKNTDGGLVVKGDKLGEFSVAGADKQWSWAEAKLEGDTVIVSSPKVKEHRFVRYAWQGFLQATLFNGAGLPAVPFRTDD